MPNNLPVFIVDQRYLLKANKIELFYNGKIEPFLVEEAKPDNELNETKNVYQITQETIITIRNASTNNVHAILHWLSGIVFEKKHMLTLYYTLYQEIQYTPRT